MASLKNISMTSISAEMGAVHQGTVIKHVHHTDVWGAGDLNRTKSKMQLSELILSTYYLCFKYNFSIDKFI